MRELSMKSPSKRQLAPFMRHLRGWRRQIEPEEPLSGVCAEWNRRLRRTKRRSLLQLGFQAGDSMAHTRSFKIDDQQVSAVENCAWERR